MVQSRPPWTQAGRGAASRRCGGANEGVGAKRFMAADCESPLSPPPLPLPRTTRTRGCPRLPSGPSGGCSSADADEGGEAVRGGGVGLPVNGSMKITASEERPLITGPGAPVASCPLGPVPLLLGVPAEGTPEPCVFEPPPPLICVPVLETIDPCMLVLGPLLNCVPAGDPIVPCALGVAVPPRPAVPPLALAPCMCVSPPLLARAIR